MLDAIHGLGRPSDWVQRWLHLIPQQAQVLDVACGAGRHARLLQSLGCQVTAVDRDAAALAHMSNSDITCLQADLEQEAWPFNPQQFDAVVMTNYLWRPVFEPLIASLKPGGVLVFETFSVGQETVGKPSRPAFLLAPNEAVALCGSLRIVAFEDGFEPESTHNAQRFVQRIVGIKEHIDQVSAQRYPLRPL